MKCTDESLLFEQIAMRRGFSTKRNGEVVEVWNRGGGLRLKPTDAGVCLEITYGREDEKAEGWIDLYTDPNHPRFPSLIECLMYGFDLMGTPQS